MALNVTLSLFEHRGKSCYMIGFPFNRAYGIHLSKSSLIHYSRRLRCYYAFEEELSLQHLLPLMHHPEVTINTDKISNKPKPKPTVAELLPPLTKKRLDALKRFQRWMVEQRLATNTINTYLDVTTLFMRYLRYRDAKTIDEIWVRRFNYDYVILGGHSISYQNQCINGIKKYLQFIERPLLLDDFERPRKGRRLPQVLSKDEVKQLLDGIKNVKHKVLLTLVYSAGLRIGEALSLRPEDIDEARMLIRVQQAKGRKDRYTLLSHNFLDLLKGYYKTYKPSDFLFEGQRGGQYTSSSAQKVLRNALQVTTIKKRGITLHSLRHSFATHLLENGTDIRYIQELLGHHSPKTTMIYTHVTDNSIRKIKNPFDEL